MEHYLEWLEFFFRNAKTLLFPAVLNIRGKIAVHEYSVMKMERVRYLNFNKKKLFSRLEDDENLSSLNKYLNFRTF